MQPDPVVVLLDDVADAEALLLAGCRTAERGPVGPDLGQGVPVGQVVRALDDHDHRGRGPGDRADVDLDVDRAGVADLDRGPGRADQLRRRRLAREIHAALRDGAGAEARHPVGPGVGDGAAGPELPDAPVPWPLARLAIRTFRMLAGAAGGAAAGPAGPPAPAGWAAGGIELPVGPGR